MAAAADRVAVVVWSGTTILRYYFKRQISRFLQYNRQNRPMSKLENASHLPSPVPLATYTYTTTDTTRRTVSRRPSRRYYHNNIILLPTRVHRQGQ